MISIITSFYNEKENLPILHDELTKALSELGEEYELFFNDDGSDDGSSEVADELAKKDAHFRVYHQRKRFGKGEGLSTGVRLSKGDVLVFMDADLQDDPQDIKKLIGKLHEGYELVNGVRVGRKHNSIIKTYSRWGNAFLQKLAQSPFTDINCGFKAFKRYVLDDVVFYGNNFRFIPLAAYSQGYKVTEVPVNNRARVHGKAKFGITKPFIGFIDTLTAYFLFRFSERPLHFFGSIGTIPLAIGLFIVVLLAFDKILFGAKLSGRPLLQFGILLTIMGLQIVMTGIIGELIVYMHKKRLKATDKI
jgi:glycosyltransferase involved in cell wall biosynthesis